MYRLLVIFLLMLLSFNTIAQDATPPPATFPTLDAIQNTIVPIADRVALAQRLRGVALADLPADPPMLAQIGAQDTFWVQDIGADRTFEIEATVRYAGEHLVAWVENGRNVDENGIRAIVDQFDANVYEQVRTLWGSEPTPGIDGDPRVHVLFTGSLGDGIGAYFAARHAFPDGITTNSNQREMFFYNLDGMPTSTIGGIAVSTLAHEFQHMIRFAVDDNDPAWVDEGFSTFTQIYLGSDLTDWMLEAYLNAPYAQLNSWSTDSAPIVAHYGASALFMTYLYDRYGLEALQAFSADAQDGLPSLARVLANYDTTVNDFFAEWLIANALALPIDQQLDTPYVYRSITLPQSAVFDTQISNYPVDVVTFANQYSGTYYGLNALDGRDTLTLSIDAPDDVRLIPVDAYSGDWMWYSHRGDTMNSTLTREFQLTETDTATLNFQVWHDIETGWDYGYVMASVDDGATWDILSTDATTDFNPYGNAYGVGYTGQSGGWIPQSISLDAYTGGNVWIRFEMISDDAVNLNNLAIDDVSIPEIGYFSDFETDDGGWIASGWMRIDNRLPQRYHIIFIHTVNNTIDVWQQTHSGDGTWDVTLDPAFDAGILIVAPLADVTTVPMQYTLTVDVE